MRRLREKAKERDLASPGSTPFISFVMPVYNEQKRIRTCLRSIFSQNYPKDKIEVLVLDGGSDDETIEIAKSFPVKVIHNKNRDAESGLSLGIRNSKGEILVFCAADQEFVSRDWLNKMARPIMEEEEIFGVKSFWLVRKSDPLVNRYCAYLQIADPLARVLDAPTYKTPKKHEGYWISFSDKNNPPLIGCELIWRKDVILKMGNYTPKFEEANFVSDVVQYGFNKYAEVPDTGFYHYYVQGVRDFIRKRIKTARKFLNRIQTKQVTWVHRKGIKRFVYAILFCVSVIGPAAEAVQEYKKTRDVAWSLHPLMCFLTVATYSILFIVSIILREWREIIQIWRRSQRP